MADPARGTSRQRDAGAATRAETRRRLVVAGAELFLERGYRATSVSAIAAQAGVSLQTLYLACGSKREVMRAVLGSAVSGRSLGFEDYTTHLRAELRRVRDDQAAEPAGTLDAFAHLFRLTAERSAPWWRVYRDAAGVDPELSRDWDALCLQRRDTVAAVLQELPDSELRAGLTRRAAEDSAWTIASPETFELLVERAGYSYDAYERWVADSLIGTIGRRPKDSAPSPTPKRRGTVTYD